MFSIPLVVPRNFPRRHEILVHFYCLPDKIQILSKDLPYHHIKYQVHYILNSPNSGKDRFLALRATIIILEFLLLELNRMSPKYLLKIKSVTPPIYTLYPTISFISFNVFLLNPKTLQESFFHSGSRIPHPPTKSRIVTRIVK